MTKRTVPPNDISDRHSVASFVFVVDDAVRDATIAGPRLTPHDRDALVEAAGILADSFGRVGASATGATSGSLPRVRIEGRILISGTCHWIARRDDDYAGPLDALLPSFAQRVAAFVRVPTRLRVVAYAERPSPLVRRLLRRSVAP